MGKGTVVNILQIFLKVVVNSKRKCGDPWGQFHPKQAFSEGQEVFNGNAHNHELFDQLDRKGTEGVRPCNEPIRVTNSDMSLFVVRKSEEETSK